MPLSILECDIHGTNATEKILKFIKNLSLGAQYGQIEET